MTPSLKTGPEPERNGDVRILVTGSRRWSDAKIVWRALLDAVAACCPPGARPSTHPFRNMTLIHGDAAGLDKLAERQAKAFGMRIESHPADWENCDPQCPPGHRRPRSDGQMYCPTAGHRRNQVMISLKPSIVLAFPIGGAKGSRGTFDCATRAQVAGLPVWWYEID